MSGQCPVCFAEQAAGLLCSNCCDRLEHDLGDVAAIVAELDVTLSRQAKIGETGKSGPGWARERLPIGVGAMDPRWVLSNVLTTWARDVTDDEWRPELNAEQSSAAARLLLSTIPTIRRHPAVIELVDEITDAIQLARRTVDRPGDRKFFGKCYAEQPGEDGKPVVCVEEIWASPHASEVKCKVCGKEWEIEERRDWLLDQAEDMIFTPREASQYVGGIGGISVGHQRIRNYLDRGRITERPSPDGVKRLRLGDLLDVLRDDAARRDACAS